VSTWNGSNRRKPVFVVVCLTHARVELGWPAFYCIQQVLDDRKATADRLVFLRHTTTLIGVTSTFELVDHA
jgi:hypothetical protein